MSKSPQSFISRNIVTIVMVPAIIALHFGWSAMQKNRSLVKEHEEIDLPLVTVSEINLHIKSIAFKKIVAVFCLFFLFQFYKYFMKKLSGDETPTKVTAAKPENP